MERRSARRASRTVLLILLLAGAAAPAAAAREPTERERAEADAAYDRGVDLFEKGAFGEAAVEFTRAYHLVPEAAFLWNIASAWEKAGNLELAEERYKAFLSHAEVDKELRDRAADSLVRIGIQLKARDAEAEAAKRAEAEAARAEAEKARAEAERARDEAERAAMEAAAAEPATGVRKEAAPPERSTTAAWVTIGLGGVGLAAGLVLGLTAEGLRQEVLDAKEEAGGGGVVTGLTQLEARKKEQDADTLATAGVVAAAFGVAAVATGVVLLFAGDGDGGGGEGGGASAGVVPLAGGGAMWTLGGRF